MARAEGPAAVTAVDPSEGRWRVTVGDGPAFEVGAEVARGFLPPGRYAVYYLPRRWPHPLCAEPRRGTY